LQQEAEPIRRVRAALAARGHEAELRYFDAHLTTAAAAAEALGVEPGRIAKSIVLFAGKQPVLVIAAGDRRVDRAKVKAIMGGGKVSIASADEVLAVTGFVAGGVAPVGLLQAATVLLDESMRRFPEVWAGGGVPEVLLRLAVADLPLVTGGCYADVTVEVT
jgi:prolyl-tRNA editing enzyme YbaK/EbsC (Cys-tRNA(Pro) deacylase)